MTTPKILATGSLRRQELDRIHAEKWRRVSEAMQDLLPSLTEAIRGLQALNRALHPTAAKRNRLTKPKK